MDTIAPKRVAIFIHPQTRLRLNALKGEKSLAEGRTLSQDDILNVLLDECLAEPEAKPTVVGHRRPAAVAGAVV